MNRYVESFRKKKWRDTKSPCETCGGTGEVHSHNPKCWDCDGAGFLLLTSEEVIARLQKPAPLPANVAKITERYIREIEWSGQATEHEKALVAGNIRQFAHCVMRPLLAVKEHEKRMLRAAT